MRQIMARSAMWGAAGLIIGPAAFYSVMLLVLWRDPGCAQGISASCKLDLWLNMGIGAVGGFVIFFAVTFVRGMARRARTAFD